MIYILSVVLCFAVSVMLAFHLYGITYGETSVEGQDHEVYRRQAKERNEVYILIPLKVVIHFILFFPSNLSTHMTAGR